VLSGKNPSRITVMIVEQ